MKRLTAVLACLTALPAMAAEQEPNNDFGSANTTSHGQVIRGAITAGDEDYFVLTINGQATIDAWTSAANGGRNMDTTLRMYDGNRASIAYNDDRGGRAEGLYSGVSQANAAAGTYYFLVKGFSNFSTGDYQFHVELSGGPDLSVTNFTLNPQPAPGQVWAASVQVNNGVGAAEATVTRLFNGEDMIGEHQTGALAANASAQVAFADLVALPIGYHDLSVCSDATGVIEELDESNNCASIQATVGLDAVAQNLILNPNPPGVGEAWSATATIRNALAGVLPASQAQLLLNDVPSGTCEVPEIANGGTHDCAFTELGGLPSGITVVKVCADSGSGIEEAAEDNNCVERRVAIGSDLIAENLVINPVNPGLNDTFNASVRIRNRFAPDTPATVARISLGDQGWGDCAVPVLAAEAHHDCVLENLNPPPAGRLIVRFCADADAEWGERNEDNNCAESNFFNGPDLQIQQVVLNPNPPVEGRSAQALVVIRNAVADPANNATMVAVTEAGQAVGTPCQIAAVGGNGIGACQINDLDFSGGAHTIQVCADADNEQVEINEDNNCTELQFSVEDVDDYEPDNARLEATLIRHETPQDHTLHNAEDVDYLFFVVNRASEAQISTGPVQEGDAFNTRIALLDADGREITSNNNGGEGNWSRLVRELLPATYYLRVNRGGNDAVDRYRINLRLIDLAARPPDLSTGVVSVTPDSLFANQRFTVSTSVSNAANAGVSQGTTAVLTVNGETAGECQLAEIATGASAPCSVVVANGAAAGDVVLRLCIDPNNTMEERDETNNCGQLNLYLYAIDEFEDDNSSDNATNLAIDDVQEHTLHVDDDVDWVEVTMSEPGTLTVTGTVAEGSGGDIDGRLTAPGGESLVRSNVIGPVSLSYGPADRGVFLVEITGRGGNRVDAYSLTATHVAVDGDVVRDMRLRNVTVDPDEPAPNAGFTLDIDSVNDGNLISSPTDVALRIDGEEVARCVLPPADPGDRSRCRDVAMPGLAEGNYQLQACIDPDGVLGETEEAQANNCAELDLTVGEPTPPQNDLRLQNPYLNPTEPIAGEMITLRMEVFYTGDDSTPPTTVNIEVNDETVHTCQIPSLDGRMTRTARCRTLPGMLQMGDDAQVMRACVDPDGQIAETDENNNCIRLLMAPGGLIGDDPDAYEEDNTWQTAGTLRDTSEASRAQEHNLHTSDDVDVMKFALQQDDQINLRVADVLGQVTVRLIDGPLQAGDAGSRMETEIELDDEGLGDTGELVAGLYAFEVRSADGFAVGRYKINAWSELGPPRPDAGPAPPDAGPPGECVSNADCTGGQRCVTDDPEPYCTNPCDTVIDCPAGFQLTCREIGPGTKACIRGEAPPSVGPADPGQSCGCSSDMGGAGMLGLLGLLAMGLKRRRRRLP